MSVIRTESRVQQTLRRIPSARATYRNPVLHGDFPDPSVIRVGERDFFAVTTSTEWAPYFPVFHSRDLVQWNRIGAVFGDRPDWATGQFWAPELSYRDGRFYVYYTARKKKGPLSIAVATATHPAGPWTDHGPLVGQQNGSIDATTAVCDGRPWLVWKEDGNALGRATTLWCQRLSDDGLSLTGPAHALMVNDAAWEDNVIEAPCVLERDGWYYLFYSGNRCCGETCRYAVGVARARSITGPWTKCERNPIMAGNAAFRGPGHGSVVTTHDRRTFYLYHAYANVAGATTVGREMMLDEIAWESDGWPSINAGAGPSQRASAPFGWRLSKDELLPFVADFKRPLDATWQWPQHQDRAAWSQHGRVLRLDVPAGQHRRQAAAVLARPARSLDYTASTGVVAQRTSRNVMASLAVYGNGANALGIGVRGTDVLVWQRKADVYHERVLGTVAGGRDVQLRIDCIWGKAYRLSYGEGAGSVTSAEVIDGSYLPPWDRGVRVALMALGKPGGSAVFSGLRIADVRAVASFRSTVDAAIARTPKRALARA